MPSPEGCLWHGIISNQPRRNPLDRTKDSLGPFAKGSLWGGEDSFGLEKEMKLARVFNEGCLLAENEGRNFIRESAYVALMGGKSPFLDKLEKVIEPLGQMVWITDGAIRIWNTASPANGGDRSAPEGSSNANPKDSLGRASLSHAKGIPLGKGSLRGGEESPGPSGRHRLGG